MAKELSKTSLLDYCKQFNIPVKENMDIEEIIQKIVAYENNKNKVNSESIYHTDLTDIDGHKKIRKLVRCIVTCLDPSKASFTGEIFTVCNASSDIISQFVQFGVPYHIPEILVNTIQDKQYTQFFTTKDKNGVEKTKTRQVKAYNVELLPPLTADEYEAIKQRQLASNKVDINE